MKKPNSARYEMAGRYPGRGTLHTMPCRVVQGAGASHRPSRKEYQKSLQAQLMGTVRRCIPRLD
jgi:hypothetical protein